MIDASSCAHGLLHDVAPALDDELRERYERVEVLDSIAWAHDRAAAAASTSRARLGSVAVHPTCSATQLGPAAASCARSARRSPTRWSCPPATTCCGMAGDRGLLHPELPRSALRDVAGRARRARARRLPVQQPHLRDRAPAGRPAARTSRSCSRSSGRRARERRAHRPAPVELRALRRGARRPRARRRGRDARARATSRCRCRRARARVARRRRLPPDLRGRTLLIDPYVSRVPLRARAAAPAGAARPGAASTATCRPARARSPAMLVGHTHFDHAIDAPAIARRFDAPAYGSSSLRAADGAARPRASGRSRSSRTPLRARPVRRHASSRACTRSCCSATRAVRRRADLRAPRRPHPGAYRCGQVWGIRIEVGGHDPLPPGQREPDRRRGPGRRRRRVPRRHRRAQLHRDYWERILRRLDPRVVVPNHYDDFFRPLGDPIGFSANVNLAAFPDEIRAVTRDAAVAALEPLRPVSG